MNVSLVDSLSGDPHNRDGSPGALLFASSCRPFKGPTASYLDLYRPWLLFFSGTSDRRLQRLPNVTLSGQKRKGELWRPPGVVVRCAGRRRRRLSRVRHHRAPPGRRDEPAGLRGRTGRQLSRRAPDWRRRTPRYSPPRAWGQGYRRGNVEVAEQPLARLITAPRWRRREPGRPCLRTRSNRRPKDERAHEQGDRRSRYRPSHRLAQLAFDGDLYRHHGPRQDDE